MPTHDARVQDIAARLHAVGFTPRVTDHDTHTHIETEVPERVTAESWQELLAALAAADWSGMTTGNKSGRSAWAGVNKETPAAVEARGRGRQL
ncbi:hypothetical protein IPZ58_15225 [Streptomyces roseoverticillatus]|uniref:hypothetical protein n=1 Tax=Streptomyces roseoverticillatus TaxID=66429 RepID=UPI001F1CAF0D|nr:hypothetical protein [Streptomyces roseoverticillatus]MCF3102932.1 hypothetical protein [Streptomyces roseoverticillatus]